MQLYMDENVNGAITEGLRARGVALLTAQEDGMAGATDPAVVDRATQLGYLLFSQDEDLIAEGTRRQRAGERFSGVVYAHQLRVPIGVCIEHLALIATVAHDEEFRDRVQFLPL